MAKAHRIPVPTIAQLLVAPPDNMDLMQRYCPGLPVQEQAQLARHIHVDENGCWPWDGQRRADGYGLVSTAGSWDEARSVCVHRYMHGVLLGAVPVGHDVHHRCEHKACWHPLHLVALTPTQHRAQHRK